MSAPEEIGTEGSATPHVGAFYGRGDVGEAILAALRTAGRDPDTLSVEDLAPVDQFHLRGREATLELAALAGVSAGARVLDVGGGLGGPARTLARERGCHVTVLDVTEEFCRVGADLTRRAGLAGRVEFRHGDATAMPFGAGAFDVAWSQHATMNIPDKTRLYGEILRVLHPHGTYAFHEVMAGPVQPTHFPVPWAHEEALSDLRTPDDTRRLLRDAGFVERAWRDESVVTREWLRRRLAAAASGRQHPLGLHLLLGAAIGPMLRNVLINLEEARIRVVMAVWERG